MYNCNECKRTIVAPSAIATFEEKYYHPNCLCCSTCKQTVSGKQFHKEKNNSLICDGCYAAKAPRCVKCHQLFKSGVSYVKVNEKTYHNECFECLSNNNSNNYNQPQAQQSSKCRKCYKPISGNLVSFKSGEYHENCLVCNMCAKKLIGESIYCDTQENPFCVDCYTQKEAKQCGKCMRLILPNQSNLVFEDKHYHEQCFACHTCRKQISPSESFYRHEDGRGVICAKCID